MTIETLHDEAGITRIGQIVAAAREAMLAAVAPGVSTAALDAIGQEVLEAAGARSAPRLAYNFPGWTCVSVNDALAHGIPSADHVLQSGDVVNVDVSAELDGYWADTGASTTVGEASARDRSLVAATEAALAEAIAAIKPGRPLSVIGAAVERCARRAGFRVIRNLAGHGVGRHIHEDPEIPNTFDRRARTVLRPGMVFTIEPFLTTKATHVVEDADGWTLRTPDGSRGAQFEHTVLVTETGARVLTAAHA